MKNIAFCFIFILFIVPLFSFGQSFSNSPNSPIFDYPQELLTGNTPSQTQTLQTSSFGDLQNITLPGQNEILSAQTNTPNLGNAAFLNPSNGLPTGVEEQVSATFTPENPKPNEPFEVSLRSFSTDLNLATIVWRENGVVTSSGRGDTVGSFFAPGVGETMTVVFEIITIEGATITKSYSFSPATVDLYYEADTYTFPFYKGRSIYTHQSNLTVFAFPNIFEEGRILDRDELSYVWEVDGDVVQRQSGYGKSSFTYNSDLLSQAVTIRVTVSSTGNPSVARNQILITPKEPTILLFENNPLYGLMMRNFIDGAYVLKTSDVLVEAIPMFFSTTRRESPDLEYQWSLNGQALSVFDDTSQIAFRNSLNEEGSATIRVATKHKRNILQSVRTSGELFFSKVSDFVETAGDDFFF